MWSGSSCCVKSSTKTRFSVFMSAEVYHLLRQRHFLRANKHCASMSKALNWLVIKCLLPRSVRVAILRNSVYVWVTVFYEKCWILWYFRTREYLVISTAKTSGETRWNGPMILCLFHCMPLRKYQCYYAVSLVFCPCSVTIWLSSLK